MGGFVEPANQVLQAFIKSVDFGFIAGGCIILCAAVIGLLIKAKTTTQLLAEAAAGHSDKTEAQTEDSTEEQQ